MKSEIEQVLLIGVRKYDTFNDRQGNEVKGGCTVTLGIPYSSDNENKFGFEIKTYTFRENIESYFYKLKDLKMPGLVAMTYHRDSAFSNNIIIDSIDSLE